MFKNGALGLTCLLSTLAFAQEARSVRDLWFFAPAQKFTGETSFSYDTSMIRIEKSTGSNPTDSELFLNQTLLYSLFDNFQFGIFGKYGRASEKNALGVTTTKLNFGDFEFIANARLLAQTEQRPFWDAGLVVSPDIGPASARLARKTDSNNLRGNTSGALKTSIGQQSLDFAYKIEAVLTYFSRTEDEDGNTVKALFDFDLNNSFQYDFGDHFSGLALFTLSFPGQIDAEPAGNVLKTNYAVDVGVGAKYLLLDALSAQASIDYRYSDATLSTPMGSSDTTISGFGAKLGARYTF